MLMLLPRRAIVLSLFAVLACAEKLPPPEFAWDHAATFSGLTTYAWYDDATWLMPQGNAIVDGQFIDRAVRQAVNEKLRKDGYSLVAAGEASFYVTYHEGSAGSLSQGQWGAFSTQTNSYGPSELQPVEPNRDSAFSASLPPPTDAYTATKYRKKDTLVLDIRDGHTKLVWRGSRTGLIGTNPGDFKKDIEHSVSVLLATFPPKL